MVSDLQIKGGAGEFEAAVIAGVLDRIAREETAASQSRGEPRNGLTAWARAVMPHEPQTPDEMVWPD